MDAIIFSYSGSFKHDLEERRDAIKEFIATVQDTYGMEVGLLSNENREDTEADTDIASLGVDFAVGDVENIKEVMTAFAKKYDKVFFVTDVRAELAAVNQSGAYTVGYNSTERSADDLGGVGPNYIVDSLEELQKILQIEHLG